jgi:hypothetical protein
MYQFLLFLLSIMLTPTGLLSWALIPAGFQHGLVNGRQKGKVRQQQEEEHHKGSSSSFSLN